MKSETAFQNKFIRELKKLPCCWYVKVSQKSISGTPDLLICLKGYFIAVELKASESSTRSNLQKYEIGSIEKAGGRAWFCYPENMDLIMTKMKMICESI